MLCRGTAQPHSLGARNGDCGRVPTLEPRVVGHVFRQRGGHTSGRRLWVAKVFLEDQRSRSAQVDIQIFHLCSKIMHGSVHHEPIGLDVDEGGKGPVDVTGKSQVLPQEHIPRQGASRATIMKLGPDVSVRSRFSFNQLHKALQDAATGTPGGNLLRSILSCRARSASFLAPTTDLKLPIVASMVSIGPT
jgi:hypothetical protein